MSSSAPDFVRRPSKGYAFRLSDDRQEEEDEPGDEGRNICLSVVEHRHRHFALLVHNNLCGRCA
jgi:hypothetical protein